MMGAMSAGQSQQFGPDVGKAKSAAGNIFTIMDIESEINAMDKQTNDGKIKCNPATFKGQIEFQNVWFRYPTRRNDWVLKGLNMKILPNETVALVGESGCGKSTTVSLILRFYDVNEGRILIDGVDVRDYDIVSLRETMGLVMQEPTLFNYTIMENVLYGNMNASNSQIRDATQISNANEFIESHNIETAFEESPTSMYQEILRHEAALVQKLGQEQYNEARTTFEELSREEEKKGVFMAVEGDIDRRGAEKKDQELHNGFTIQCGIKGSKLSGGQKQRIAIARAIIRKPQLLILDEATSALDESSQRKVQVALDNIMKNRTSIVIAHRLSTIEKCDRIMVLESGRLVESGNFSELKQKEGGIFSQLASGLSKAQNAAK